MARSMNRIHCLSAISGSLAVFAIAITACDGDDVPPRETFESTPDAAPDSSSASLPDAAPSGDEDADVADAGEPYDGSAKAVTCTATPCALDITAGAHHFCARLDGGTVQCWGDDTSGALGGGPAPDGLGDDDARGTVEALGLTEIVQISTAGNSNCALSKSGVTRCWGANTSGQLGISPQDPYSDWDTHYVAINIASGATFTRIDVGLATTCGLDANGGGLCWGDNSTGQLTSSDFSNPSGPSTADFAGNHLVRTAFSAATGYGLTDKATLVTWGTVAARPSSIASDPSPAPIPGLSGVVDLAVGATHACAITGGDVYCWGSSAKQALCNGLPDAQRFPTIAPIFDKKKAQQISVGTNSTCIRLTNGELQCCGDDTYGQLGDENDAGTLAPAFRPVATLKDPAVRVVTADDTTCALLETGEVVCWGGNTQGELGGPKKDSDPHPVPTKVVFR